VPEIPQKDFYRLSEVCQYTDTQPYVLRFWEGEFPQLHPDQTRGGQRLYRKQDVELVLRIKQLLYEEEYTIAGARTKLEEEQGTGTQTAEDDPPRAHRQPAPAPFPRTAEPETVPRERYEDAVDEIEHLRYELRELDKKRRRAEGALEKADAAAEVQRQRCEAAQREIEQLLEYLG
jgi:DNA-binding transcriptional MerR regulator